MSGGAHGDAADHVTTEVEAERVVASTAIAEPPPYVVVFEETASRLVPLPRDGTVRIGRSSEVEIQLDHAKVSRNHALIMVRSSRASVRDLGSNNGTTVDGAAIAGEVPLRPGAVIGI